MSRRRLTSTCVAVAALALAAAGAAGAAGTPVIADGGPHVLVTVDGKGVARVLRTVAP